MTGTPLIETDFIIVGAGIAGASIAHWLAPYARVIILERENQPGYHSTGRSAALFFPSYGTSQVRALTRASREFLEHPPHGFCSSPLLRRRGALTVAGEEHRKQLEQQWATLTSITGMARRLSAAEACAMVPVLKRERLYGGVFEPDAFDMDVDALHQGYLRAARRAGASLVCNAEVTAIERAADAWLTRTGHAVYRAPVIINAAGAWVDAVAHMAGVQPIDIQPKRRSAFVFTPPEKVDTRGWPLVIGADEDWYIKPDAGLLLGSAANADLVAPHDVQPEELDLALAIDRIETMTSLKIHRPTRAWAGLRSFVTDGDLVGGFDKTTMAFFWVAAQGGYGIQTSPAMGEACAALARGLPIPDRIRAFGVTAEILSPVRLQ
jgi:D-arginine dehydrogenase